MSEGHPDHAHPASGEAHAGPNFQTYIMVFCALCVFTALSFVFNTLANYGVISHEMSVVLIVIVAVIKALCVAMIFMHLKFDFGRLYCIIIPVSIMAVMMIIVLLPDIVIGCHHGLYAKTDEAAAVAPKH